MSLMFHSHKVLYYLLSFNLQWLYLKYLISAGPSSCGILSVLPSMISFVVSPTSVEFGASAVRRFFWLCCSGWALGSWLWLAGSSRAGSFFPAIPGGGGRLWPELMVPWGKLGKAGLLPSLQQLVVKGSVRQMGPAGDPAWPTHGCLSSGGWDWSGLQHSRHKWRFHRGAVALAHWGVEWMSSQVTGARIGMWALNFFPSSQVRDTYFKLKTILTILLVSH